MEADSIDIVHRQFRKRWMGWDPNEVRALIQQVSEDMQRLKAENAGLRRSLQEHEKELKEYREREKAIRNILVNVQKTAEQMKANAEKEAGLIVSEAELKAGEILQGAQQRLAQLNDEIAELKRHRVQLKTKLRATIEAYQQILGLEEQDEKQTETESRVMILNR
jgi:cell division initiation protein